jgi:hypothetical protein
MITMHPWKYAKPVRTCGITSARRYDFIDAIWRQFTRGRGPLSVRLRVDLDLVGEFK